MPDPVVAAVETPAAVVAPVTTTLATDDVEIVAPAADPAVAEAAAKAEAERVAALTPEQKNAEEAALAKTKAEATEKANADATEKARRDALSDLERKAEDDAKAKADAEAEAAKHAPEAYEFTSPKGVNVDAETVDAFKALAKEYDLPQAKAQQLFDLGMQVTQKNTAALYDGVTKLQAEWLAKSLADPEFGGEKIKENVAIAKQTIAKYGDAELKEVLNTTKLGDHPALMRWMFRVGKAMAEDTFVTGHKNDVVRDNSDEGRAKRLYPLMNP